MNANEMADALAEVPIEIFGKVRMIDVRVMLRQQQAEIEALKNPILQAIGQAFDPVKEPKPVLYINEKTLLHGNGGDTFWDTEVSWWPEDGFVPLYAR